MADTTQQMAAAEEKKEDAVPQQAKAHRMLQVSILVTTRLIRIAFLTCRLTPFPKRTL